MSESMTTALGLGDWIRVIEVPAFGLVLHMVLALQKRVAASETALVAAEAKASQDLAAYKLEATDRFASIGHLREVEGRLVGHLEKIEHKLDRALGHERSASDAD